MKLLLEIDDSRFGDALPAGLLNSPFPLREAARAIIFNAAGQIALLKATQRSYHKLPGGGIDAGESWEEAAMREAVEEIGFTVSLRPLVVGKIIEYRYHPSLWLGEDRLKQISYCGIADVTGGDGVTHLEAGEIAAGLTPIWCALDDAIAFMQKDEPSDYEGKFINLRDLTFLQTAKQLLAA